MGEPAERELWVRATVGLQGLPLNHFARVDPDDDEIQQHLDAKLIVPATPAEISRYGLT